MRTCWFEHELRVVTRNTIIDMIVRKANKADAFWAKVDRWVRRILK